MSQAKELLSKLGPSKRYGTPVAEYSEDGPFRCDHCKYANDSAMRCDNPKMKQDHKVKHDDSGLAIIKPDACCGFFWPST